MAHAHDQQEHDHHASAPRLPGSLRGPYKSWLRRAPGTESRDVFRLSAAHDEWNHLVIPLLALERGYFSDEGLGHVEVLATEDEQAQVDGLAEGWLDVAVDPLATLILAAHVRGEPVFIGAGRRKGYTFLLFGARGLKDVSELRGKRIVTAGQGGVTDVQGREIVRRLGMEPDRDVTFVYKEALHDVMATVDALEAGEGEAIMVPVSLRGFMESQGYPLLLNSGEFFAPRHDRVMAISGSRLSDDPAALTSSYRALMRAADDVLDPSQAESIRDAMEMCGFPVRGPHDGQAFDLIMDALYLRIDPRFDLPTKGLVETIAEAQRAGSIPPDFQVEGALRLEPLKEAQRTTPAPALA